MFVDDDGSVTYDDRAGRAVLTWCGVDIKPPKQTRHTPRRRQQRHGRPRRAGASSSSSSADPPLGGDDDPEQHHVADPPDLRRVAVVVGRRTMTSHAKVATLTARLARVALDLAEVADELADLEIDGRDEWLIIPAANHVRISYDWLQTILLEIDAHGRYYGEAGRRWIPITSTTRTAA
jgi:hypothetical protein